MNTNTVHILQELLLGTEALVGKSMQNITGRDLQIMFVK